MPPRRPPGVGLPTASRRDGSHAGVHPGWVSRLGVRGGCHAEFERPAATSAVPEKTNYSKTNLCNGKSNARSLLKSAIDFFSNSIFCGFATSADPGEVLLRLPGELWSTMIAQIFQRLPGEPSEPELGAECWAASGPSGGPGWVQGLGGWGTQESRSSRRNPCGGEAPID